MSLSTTLALSGLILSLCGPPQTGNDNQDLAGNDNQAVSGDPKSSKTTSTTRVVALTHLDAHALARTLGKLHLPVRVSPTDNNRILLYGSSARVNDVIELIGELDVPEASEEGAADIHFIPLGQYPPGELLALIETVATSYSTRVAMDEVNGMLVVQGGEREIARIRRLVEAVDKPSQSVTIYFYFIRASIGSDFDPEDHDLPKALAPVARTIIENGFGDPSLLATVIVTVDEGRRFEQKARLQGTTDNKVTEVLEFSVSGAARLQPNRDLVQIELSVVVEGGYSEGEETFLSAGETVFSMKTAVATKLGGYVVLAAGPGSTATGNAIVLVIQVNAD